MNIFKRNKILIIITFILLIIFLIIYNVFFGIIRSSSFTLWLAGFSCFINCFNIIFQNRFINQLINHKKENETSNLHQLRTGRKIRKDFEYINYTLNINTAILIIAPFLSLFDILLSLGSSIIISGTYQTTHLLKMVHNYKKLLRKEE